MKRLNVSILMTVIIGLCAISLFGKRQDDKDKKLKKKLFVDYNMSLLTEDELRHEALTTAMPMYPEDAAAEGIQGLVHVAVLYDENGEFKAMKVLESPSPKLSKAVAEALKQWRMRITYDSPYSEARRPVRDFGEVRFHFIILDGTPAVEPATTDEQKTASEKFIKISGPSKDPEKMSWP